eukprot:1154587-Pyramimonas_sp.AAC.1
MCLHYSEEESKTMSSLPRREQEVILFHDLKFGRLAKSDPREHVVDISQTLGRNGILWNGVPCVTPKGKLWLRKRFRLLVPPEALAAQGFPLFTYERLSPFSVSELNDLAGGAFNAHTAAAF